MPHLGNLPAFPVPMNAVDAGVSRRDWFAAVAIQGIAARGLEVSEDRVLTDDDKNEIMARRAYALADAMITVSVTMPPKRRIVKKRKQTLPAALDAEAQDLAEPPEIAASSTSVASDAPDPVAASEG